MHRVPKRKVRRQCRPAHPVLSTHKIPSRTALDAGTTDSRSCSVRTEASQIRFNQHRSGSLQRQGSRARAGVRRPPQLRSTSGHAGVPGGASNTPLTSAMPAAHGGRFDHRIFSAFIATAFAQDNAEAAKLQWRRVADQRRPEVPKLAALMDAPEPAVLVYLGFPTQHQVKLPSTNPTERLNGEIKRRTEVVGIFLNEAAITRLVGAILLEQLDEQAVQRARYMAPQWITPIGDDPLVSLSTPAA